MFKVLNIFIYNILSLKHIRDRIYKLFKSEKDCLYYETFVREMNNFSSSLGLTNTNWINASGLQNNGTFSFSTARDMARMGLIAYMQDDINKFWSEKEYTLQIVKPYIIPLFNKKYKKAISTIPYTKLGPYEILGAKTGTGDGYNALLCVCRVANKIVSGVVLDSVKESERFSVMKDLMDIALEQIRGNKHEATPRLEKAKMACAYVIEESELICIYEQNADSKYPVMSLAKVMTFMVFSKYIRNYSGLIRISPLDLDKSDILKSWEKVKICSLIYLMLLPSSCTAADALARYVGKLIYYR